MPTPSRRSRNSVGAGATTVRAATLELCRAFGMTTVFGNPGSTELPMFRDFPSDFRYVLGLQESVVVAMADGFAQATRNAALVNLHAAAGLGHALGNIFTAFRNQTPLVITAGQQARSILPYEPYLFADAATEFPKPYVKWSCQPARAEDVPAAIARAYFTAMQFPRGPTFVSIPVDDWDRSCAPLAPREVSHSVGADPAMLAEIADALADARTPTLIVGAALARDDAWEDVIALAERHEARVWASPMSGRNSFPENHRLFAGFLPANRARIVESLSGSDLVLVLGAPIFTYHVEGDGPHAPTGARVYHLTDDPAAAAWAPIGTSVVTGLRLGVQSLLRGPAPRAPRPTPPIRDPAPELAARPLTDAYVFHRIAALRPDNSIIVEEAPSSRPAMQRHLPMLRRDSFYTCASGGLGHGLPAAIGVALARRSERVIAVLGDGSAMYAIQGLWSAAALDLPIAFIILNNQRYQAMLEFGRHFGVPAPVGVDLAGIDFAALAIGQGCAAVAVTDADDLDRALANAFTSDGPVLVEVRIA